jgi:7-carboxy-7-deazaguanine synthase
MKTSRAHLPIQPRAMVIAEEFMSIQGEGSLVGMPSYFVRVTGCPLRCVWCDEPSTSWEPKGERHSVADILARVVASGLRHVVLTGGEPFSQVGSVDLAQGIKALGLHLTIETSGAVARPGLACDLMSISPKLAHSTPKRRGENLIDRHNRLRCNPELLRVLVSTSVDWQVKAVVRPAHLGADLAELSELLAAANITSADHHRVFLTPEGVDAAALDEGLRSIAPACIANGYRLGHRLHLSLYGNTKGT